MAKKGIDFLAAHSGGCDDIHIGFYGGEPLLEFELIKKCMEYAKERCFGKRVYFNLTTNGTLLTREMVKVFEQHNLQLLVSLDGPKEIHDLSRKFISNEGSFDKLFENMQMIKDEFPQYYEKHISFNTVLNPEHEYNCISDFISSDELLKNKSFLSGIISPVNAKNQKNISEKFYEEERYEYFLVLLEKINEISQERKPPLKGAESYRLDEIREQKNRKSIGELPRKSHHGGPCIPGNFRLFMNVDGDLFPCEKVCENSEFAKMGNIEEGIDLCQVKKIMNIERLTQEYCHNCWAYYYCHICVADIDMSYEDPAQSILDRCPGIRKHIEDTFKDYCVLKEYGFQY